jgi:sugar phosphate isomerase/epimerase
MKLGIMSACFSNNAWDNACQFAKEAGLQAIESPSGGFDGSYHCNPIKMAEDEDAIKAFNNSAAKRGLEKSVTFLKQCMLFDPAGRQWWDEFMQ